MQPVTGGDKVTDESASLVMPDARPAPASGTTSGTPRGGTGQRYGAP